MKKFLAVIALAIGLTGAFAAAATPASADHLPPIHIGFDFDGHGTCLLNADVTVFGNHINLGDCG